MIFLVVNYHYVAQERPRSCRAIFPVAVADLVAQLELLGRHFSFVGRDDVLAAVRGGRALPARSCLVTFDDGLRCQAELAVPTLADRGIPALFLVAALPLEEGRALYVHKIHHLREHLDDAELLALLQEAGVPSVSDEAARAQYAYDTAEAARVKYLLNVALPLEARETLIGEVFERVVEDEAAFCEELYMSPAQIAELELRHGAVGAHSYAHEPLALLGPDALRSDLRRTAAVLGRVTGRRPLAISYPHGSAAAVSPEVGEAAAEAGFVAGFTMERAFNRTLGHPLLLARVDANDAPGGSRPLFELGDGGPSVRPGMSPGRERYLREPA